MRADSRKLLFMFACCSILLFCYLAKSHPFLLSDSTFWTYSTQELNKLTLVHFNSNAFLTWTLDPFLALLAKIAPFQFFICSILLITGAGIFFFLRRFIAWNQSSLELAGAAFSIIALLFLQFGADIIILSAMVWFPWLLYCAEKISIPSAKLKITWLMLFVATLALSATSANLYAPILAVVFLIAVHSNFQAGSGNTTKLFAVCAVLVLTSAVAAIYFYSFPSYPTYPIGQFVVPRQFLSTAYTSSIGPEPELLTLNRLAFQDLYLPICILVFIFCAAASLPNIRPTVSSRNLSFLLCASSLSLFVFLDSSLIPQEFHPMMPLQTIQRTIPGAAFVPLTHIFVAVAIVFTGIALASLNYGTFLCILFCLLGGLQAVQLSDPTRQSDRTLWTQLESTNEVDSALKILVSPSYFVVRYFGSWTLKLLEVQSALTVLPISKENAVLRASSHSELLDTVLLRRSRSRWSASKGRQEGINEWIWIGLKSKTNFKALELSSGNFRTDFPRGLRIKVAEGIACESLESFNNYRTVFENPDLIGNPEATAEGFPYFQADANTRAYLANAESADCILVEQTGIADNYDWSVSKIDLLN